MSGRKPRERATMSLQEISEMLMLKDWTREKLADMLDLSLNTIDRWFCKSEEQRRHPSVEHVEKMRAWLLEAREEKMRAWKKEAVRQPA